MNQKILSRENETCICQKKEEGVSKYTFILVKSCILIDFYKTKKTAKNHKSSGSIYLLKDLFIAYNKSPKSQK